MTAAVLATSSVGELLSVGRYLLWTTVGACAGALLVAYFLGVKSGILTADAPLKRLAAIAQLKGIKETDWQIFLRGIGCNWLVCLAVWMALGAQDIGGKILAIFFPIADSWRWASTTRWPTCSSCPPRISRESPSPGVTSCGTGCSRGWATSSERLSS
jgi:hypothetical protein